MKVKLLSQPKWNLLAWAAAALAFTGYISTLYLPGQLVWLPDFLAFMGETPSRFFPSGYGSIISLFGGGVAAGRVWSALGLAISLGIIVAATRRNPSPFMLSLLALAAALLSPSVFNSALSPSVDMLYTGLALLLLTMLFTVLDSKARNPRGYFILAIIALIALGLALLRYHTPALLVTAAVACIPALKYRLARLACLSLVTLAALTLLLAKLQGYSGTAIEQVYCGLEFRYQRLAERGVLDGLPRGNDVNGYVWDQYHLLAETARTSRLLDYYSAGELLKHAAVNYFHYLRRPMVLLGLAAAIAAVMLGLHRRLATSSAIFLLAAPGPLSIAYYTLRSSLLLELAGIATACYFLSTILTQLTLAKRRAAFILMLFAFCGTYYIHSYRLAHEISEWNTQLEEARFVEGVIKKLPQAPSHKRIWTEDSSITIRLGNKPVSAFAQAYGSWLDGREVVSPATLAQANGSEFDVLLFRTPEQASQIAGRGKWNYSVSSAGGQRLYVLYRKQPLEDG